MSCLEFSFAAEVFNLAGETITAPVAEVAKPVRATSFTPARLVPTPPADTFAEVKTEARTPRPFRTNHHD